MSATETTVTPMAGFCFLCGNEVDGDLRDHFSEQHQRVSTKPTATISAWKQRLDTVGKAIKEIRQESDTAIQIQRLDDEVIKELYLVRASLSQSKRRAAQVKRG